MEDTQGREAGSRGGLLAEGAKKKGEPEAAAGRHLVGLQLQQGACTSAV